MKYQLRPTIAVILGFVSAATVMLLCESINHYLFPFPDGMDVYNIEDVRAFAASMPLTSLILVLIGWIAGTTLGGYVSTKVAKTNSPKPALTLGAIVTLSALANAIMIMNPWWFHFGGLLVFVPLAYLGFKIATRT